MPNGNILTTSSGVHEVDRSGNLGETKIGGASARFITFLPPDNPLPPIPTMSEKVLLLLVLCLLVSAIVLARKRRQAT